MIGRIPILDISPVVENGEFPAKAVTGERLWASATIFREGHDYLRANVVLKDPSGKTSDFLPMHEAFPDRWSAAIRPDVVGEWSYYIEAWDDPVGTWIHAAEIKIPSGIDVDLVLEEGAQLFGELAKEYSLSHYQEVAAILRDDSIEPRERLTQALSDETKRLIWNFPLRRLITQSQEYRIQVDRERALFGSWYEFFPRSEVTTSKLSKKVKHGTFRSSYSRLEAAAEMGFDVVYLPPIHPIGYTHRKGPNNTLTAGVNDPGVPWAIGNKSGGHDAIHPDLGTIKDFEKFVSYAKSLNLEIAMDLALQASPDHPWVASHPEWFSVRVDGSIAYAENPPKKYQDIFPINFDNDYNGILNEVIRIVRFWISKGVTIFRVDNPHTKPVHFWRDLLSEIHSSNPEIIFLAEAFTKPVMMHTLGKVGFHQSYTYFTWRTSKAELEAYGSEVSHQTSDFFRPNFWVNTPDINPFHLQSGNQEMFALRAILAATMSPSWGMYAGYELFEYQKFAEGGEEYLDSEKYQLKPRNWQAAEKSGKTLTPLIKKLNQIRKTNSALARLRNISFHHTDSDQVIAFSKRDDDEGSNRIIVIANLDPTKAIETSIHLDLGALGFGHDALIQVTDLLDGKQYQWSSHNFVRFAPGERVAHILKVN